jgi:glutathione S-transferase
MNLTLFAHPFSSYCQKVLTALYENATPFTYRRLSIEDDSTTAELAALWPLKRFPVLIDDGKTVLESSIIIEHLGLHHPGSVSLLPQDPAAALETRLMDRIFDNYVMTPMQRIVFDFIRPAESRDPLGVAQAREMLDNIYLWLDEKMKDRPWAAGDAFSLADCAAAPALFYADWTHPIDSAFTHLKAYRARLLARPSFARAVDEARPYRAYFPLGAPDRD